MAVSLRTRLIAWYSALLLLALGAFIGIVLLVHWRLVLRQFDEGLETLSVMAENVMDEEMGERAKLALAAEDTEEVVRAPDHRVRVLDANGLPLTPHGSVFPFDVRAEALSTRSGPRTVSATDGHSWRVVVRAGTTRSQQYFTVIGAPLDDVLDQSRALVKAAVVGLPVVLLLGGIGGWWLVRHGLRPLTVMAAQARDITARTAGSRLQVPPFGDELSHLADSFNRVLERLSDALAEQRRFMADASHELRTPVSIIRTATEVTLSRPDRQPAEYQEAFEAVAQQAARLARLVDDMLVLARADAGGYPITMSAVDLSVVARETVHDLALQASQRNITLTTHALGSLVVRGDETLLRRVVSNLLQNGIVYTPAGGRVDVSLQASDGSVELRVRDSGPGIPEADRHRVFERFVRLDPARAGGGSGLGLAIARWIVEAHGGSLALVRSGPDGSIFVARFERDQQEDRANRR